MDVVGSEIGQKMRSAIKAKLTELGCYVDDELPDYVMVMVANKRTRAQMEDDLQLFLGDNTELFVNWLHQVLKKLQEVTVPPPAKPTERDKSKERSASKERKSKDKKLKSKTKKSDLKKAKKKEKEKSKSQKKKEEKKSHKKKKSKHHEMIRPNIPPLLMNIEKESEPSITDVFAGQILKNHGVLLDPTPMDEPKESKPEIKRPIVPIIDPATIFSEPPDENNKNNSPQEPKEDQIKEINEIEAKIQGLKAKLAEQLDSMSDDEDFLNIRTEAEELMNDFAEDVFQEISSQTTTVATPPIPPAPKKSPSPSLSEPLESPETLESPIHEPIKEKERTKKVPINIVPSEKPIEMETLPQIELNLPKRPIRERLGALEKKIVEKELKPPESPERYTPERDPEIKQSKTAKSRLGDLVEPQKRNSVDEGSEKNDTNTKRERISSRVSSVLCPGRGRVKCASVVRVRPRPRVGAPANSLLLRAVADAHKSLLNTPPKIEPAPKVQRALVLPMRRSVEAPKIVIQVAGGDAADDCEHDAISLGDPDSEDDKSFKLTSDEKEEYIPVPITKKIHNTDYTPSRRNDARTTSIKDDSIVIETINIHNPTVDKDKNTQFIVTMDGYHPNVFLAKKLQTEGLLEDETIDDKPTSPKKTDTKEKEDVPETSDIQKRLSNTSEESATQVIIKKEPETPKSAEKRKNIDLSVEKKKNIDLSVEKRKNIDFSIKEEVPVKRRRSSPIVFDVDQQRDKEKEKEKDRERQRTESASSDNHVVITTNTGTHKYDSLPPLSIVSATVGAAKSGSAPTSPPTWCRSFPDCRYGSRCAFQHPRCKFAAACTRRYCVYSHAAQHAAHTPVASTVVPAANYKSISTSVPAMCKFYPACVNPACHFYHPKPCRYGKNCTNKLDCNFYHADLPNKWFPA